MAVTFTQVCSAQAEAKSAEGMCAAESAYTPNAVTHYDCKSQMSKEECTAKQGDEYTDGI